VPLVARVHHDIVDRGVVLEVGESAGCADELGTLRADVAWRLARGGTDADYNCLDGAGDTLLFGGRSEIRAGVESLIMQSVLSPEDQALLTRLEESLWIEASRFDESFMQRALAADFLEFGKSGRMHTRDAVLSATRHAIGAVLPLRELQIRLLDENTAQITYVSDTESTDGGRLLARRSSIWSRTLLGWQLRFHQGTPVAR
jgi:hypothetical protein